MRTRGRTAAVACLVVIALRADAFSSTRLAVTGTRKRSVRLAVAPTMPAEGEGGTQTQAEVVWPAVIQGGMGIQVSSWKLARQVALHPSGLGIVSATCMEAVLARRLQNGDVDDVYHRALASFPDQAMAKRVLDKYFVEGGKAAGAPYKSLPMWTMEPKQELLEVTVLANYCEVWLAKHDDEGHLIDGVAGINLLTKVQLPTIASLYGAVLAAADYVIMGAGIPMEVPKILDELAANADTKLAIDVGGSDDAHYNHFSPAAFWAAAGRPELVRRAEKRPAFIPIVSSVTLAMSMLKRAKGAGPTKGIQGFVIEMPTAGGHNAPPRGFRYDPLAKSHVLDLNDKGEPVYGPKDDVDLKAFAKYTKGLPFWLVRE